VTIDMGQVVDLPAYKSAMGEVRKKQKRALARRKLKEAG